MKHLAADMERDHPLSKIDARIKLVVGLILLVLVLSYGGFAFPAGIAVIALILCRVMKVPLRLFALRFAEPLFIALILIALKLFFSGKEILFSFSLFGLQVAGHTDGLLEGLLIACRIAGAVSIVAVLGFSTPFAEIISALSWLRVPRGFIEILMLAYRYIFVLIEDAMVIYAAQKNRLGYAGVRRGLSSFGTLAGALTLKAFEGSQTTAQAMVQRGYDGTMPLLSHRPFRMAELFGAFAALLGAGALWML